MKKFVLLLLAIGGAYYALNQPDSAVDYNAPQSSSTAPRAQNDSQWRAGQQVSGTGTVDRVLSDDNDGSRHQRFILRLSSGRTLLVAHNIDLAPRVSSLGEGDTVSFYGEFEPNDRGGVIHWTHHDPQGRHAAGWLEHNGQRYQ
ncbi:MAG: DUF3465 domain-containing protein [Gammaproteobacteria bacterium]|nr:DUF3465 domain-containing protein [Gammaproteobacteria bacterium]MDH4315194.1 DUF3465 domain-containing protein [Gammaproteobacteria bacterium]MDH5215888.1 DUF3465 domain-containing protein [Gammaproteobacteria bacterium]MDH5501731.1 DUF3465 domain-containing protein [Gammaproteobacteria bacterium]